MSVHWEYRIVHLEFKGDDADQYEISQVCIDDETGEVLTWDRTLDVDSGFSVDDLRTEVDDLWVRVGAAFARPPLKARDLPSEGL